MVNCTTSSRFEQSIYGGRRNASERLDHVKGKIFKDMTIPGQPQGWTAFSRFEQGRLAASQIRFRGVRICSLWYKALLPLFLGFGWVNRLRPRNTRMACFRWYPNVAQKSSRIPLFFSLEAFLYRRKTASIYSLFDHGLIVSSLPIIGNIFYESTMLFLLRVR